MVTEVSENDLIAQTRQGDSRAFEQLIYSYQDKVFNLAHRILRNQEDAEEVLQDVFLTIHSKLDHFEGRSAFSSWIYRVTANSALMKIRRRKRHQSTPLDNLGDFAQGNSSQHYDSSTTDYLSSRHELRAMLQNAIDNLPVDYRAIFILRDVDGLSTQQVSEVLDLTIPTIKSRLHRARLILRKRLQRCYQEYTGNSTRTHTAGPAGHGMYIQ